MHTSFSIFFWNTFSSKHADMVTNKIKNYKGGGDLNFFVEFFVTFFINMTILNGSIACDYD